MRSHIHHSINAIREYLAALEERLQDVEIREIEMQV